MEKLEREANSSKKRAGFPHLFAHHGLARGNATRSAEAMKATVIGHLAIGVMWTCHFLRGPIKCFVGYCGARYPIRGHQFVMVLVTRASI
jgi:hypothetical protein